MQFLWNFILGAVVAAGGVFVVMKTDHAFGIVGQVEWAERNLGPGGTRSFLKIVGVIICFIGFSIMTGLGKELFLGTIGRFLMIKQ